MRTVNLTDLGLSENGRPIFFLSDKESHLLFADINIAVIADKNVKPSLPPVRSVLQKAVFANSLKVRPAYGKLIDAVCLFGSCAGEVVACFADGTPLPLIFHRSFPGLHISHGCRPGQAPISSGQ